MSTIARFAIPADQFALGDVLEVRRGIRVRLESMIPTGEATIPYFWVPTDDADAVDEALRASELVDDVRILDQTDTETLFRVDWSRAVDGLVDIIEQSEAVILEAQGEGDDWSFRMRFPEQEDISEFYQTCVDAGLSPRLEEINNPRWQNDDGFGLTDAQRDALVTALDAGYFAVPRKTTLQELAEQFDISDTAFSQRLRRGLTKLLSSTMGEEPRLSVEAEDDD
ncbi:helix-turn-helix domain-containing protein [Halomarina salina]|uniref:Helix-turn-helix domain-containing protein n=1 Tax=Halomarina salina TaxID=1872699 RepID=A0ABD5RP04_9EURY|nr:helix-turn-helix domain-containing protein [Halomarina salina]